MDEILAYLIGCLIGGTILGICTYVYKLVGSEYFTWLCVIVVYLTALYVMVGNSYRDGLIGSKIIMYELQCTDCSKCYFVDGPDVRCGCGSTNLPRVRLEMEQTFKSLWVIYKPNTIFSIGITTDVMYSKESNYEDLLCRRYPYR